MSPDIQLYLIDGPALCAQLYGEVAYNHECAVDTETDGLYWSLGNKPFMATFTPNEWTAYACYDPVMVGKIMRKMESMGVKFKFHNAKFDLHMLRVWKGCEWYPVDGYVGLDFGDSMHATRLQYPQESAALKSISQKFDPVYEGIDVTAPQIAVKTWIRDHTTASIVAGKLVKHEPGFDAVPTEIMMPYAMQDTIMTLRLDHFLKNERKYLKAPPGFPSADEVYQAEIDCLKVCIEMERFGFPVDGDELKKVTAEAQLKYAAAKAAWDASPWGQTLPSSPTGLRKILYGEKLTPEERERRIILGLAIEEGCGEPVKHRTKETDTHPNGQAATDEAALMDCETPQGKIVAEHILSIRGWKKYLERLSEIATFRSVDGRVHTSLNSDRARTGRFSSTQPALQNLSRPDPKKPWTMARDLFRPEPGMEFLLADFSQIELRLAAHYMDDAEMIYTLATGGDLHRDTAAAMYGIAPELVTKKQRAIAKILNFSILYGAGVRRVTETLRYGAAGTDPLTIEEVHEALHGLNVSYEDLSDEACYKLLAETLLNAFHKQRPKVREFLNRATRAAEKRGGVYTAFGLFIPLPPIWYRGKQISTTHKAGNAVIQGTAAGLMKATIVRADKACKEYCKNQGLTYWKEVGICMTIHDELIFQVPEGHAESLAEYLDPILSAWPQFKIPIKLEYAKVANGSSWAYKKDFELTKVAA